MHFAQRTYILLVLTAVLAIAGIWSSESAFAGLWRVPAALLLLGLAFESAIARRTQISTAVETATRAHLGREQAAAFTFHNSSSRAVSLQYAPVVPEVFEPLARVREVVVPARGSGRDRVTLLPVRLGTRPWLALSARMLGVFGLAWWPRELQPSTSVTVVADTLSAAVARPPGNPSGARSRRVVGAGAELHQLREYRYGDPLAWVDWKATARTRRLVTREYSEDQHLDILVAIDAGRFSRVRAGVLDRFGIYANVAARFAEIVAPADDRIGLMVYSDRLLGACAPTRGLAAVTRLRRTLEASRAESAESDPIAAAIRIRGILRRRGLVVLLTDLDDANGVQALTRGIRLLSPPHFVVVGVIRSPEIAALAAGEEPGRSDPWVALAAQEHDARVSLQHGRLRRLGASVVVSTAPLLEKSLLAEYEALRRSRRV